jgi:predicted porin
MNKKLITLAVAAALVAPAAAMADATIYGKLNMSVDYFDADAGPAISNGLINNRGEFDGWAVNKGPLGRGEGRANRLGVKGSEDLGNGLKAIYQIEFGVTMAEENGGSPISGGDDTLSMRNSFVGLAGGWGTLLVGRHDTPMKISTGKLDLFSDTMADYNGTIGFQDLRVDNAIAYISPSFAGFQLAAASHVGGGASVSGINNLDSDSLAEAYSIAAIYKNGPFYGAAAYEVLTDDLIGFPDGVDGDDFDKWRVGLGLLDWNGFTLAGVYENQDPGGDLDDRDLWQISAGYAFGNNMIKANYGQNDGDDLDIENWTIGFDHNFSKRTTAYLLYTDTDRDLDGDLFEDDDDDGLDWSGFSIGVIHNF